MQDLNEHLMKKFGKPVSEISKTGFDNKLIDKNFKMISWDDVAIYFNETNEDFDEKFSTADGLFIHKKENKTQLFFMEFKNIDYSNVEDRQMSLFHLKNYLKQMDECEHDCDIYEDFENISKHLVDESHVSLRTKPYDSLSLFFHIMKDFYKSDSNEDDENEDREYEILIEKLFECDKFFYLVSNTEFQYLPFKNINNRQNNIIRPLSFLKRLEPYHYKMVLAVNKKGFDRYFYNRYKEFLH